MVCFNYKIISRYRNIPQGSALYVHRDTCSRRGKKTRRENEVSYFHCTLCTSRVAARVRACNFVKSETRWNLPLTIVAHTAHAV